MSAANIAALPTAAPPVNDRDLSWLDFDRRVLELAGDPQRPLAERVKLCAIVSSNLDEFFSVRIARIRARRDWGASAVLAVTRAKVLALQLHQDALWRDELAPALAANGVRVAEGELTDDAAAAYHRTIEPLLHATVIGRGARFPHVDARTIAALARTDTGDVALVLAPRGLRFVHVGDDWLSVEAGLARCASTLVPGRTIEAIVAFRITRSAKLGPETGDVGALEQQVAARRFGEILRVEVPAGAPASLTEELLKRLGLDRSHLYEPSAPIGLADLGSLLGAIPTEQAGRAWQPATPPGFAGASGDELFARLRRRARLVHHPYESFEESVQAFADSARDAAVTALSATVYRTSRPSGTLGSLVESAAAGKRALCLVELRARFDEQHNVEWSRTLRAEGVEVVHGPAGLKVHSKLLAITRIEDDGPRTYVHIGTGNYHASNAFGYEDLSLFSADRELAADVQQVFETVRSGERPEPFRKLLVGPWYLRSGLMREIAAVTEGARRGEEARIRIKVNTLGDEEIVHALYAASQAGVDIQLVVRGACTLLPGIPGTSDRITVRSVLGRFLEHSRIFSFECGGERRMWIGSADLLPRNLDRRIETLAPVEEEGLQARLAGILDTLLAATRDAWELDAHGNWHRLDDVPGDDPVSAQELFAAHAARALPDR